MRRNTCYYSILAAIGLTVWLGTQPALAFVTVIVQPSSQVGFVGSNVVFTAQATPNNGEIITGYTWLTSPNGLNPFTTIPGATTATCTLVNVHTNDTGYYFAKVTFNSGTDIGLTSVSSAVTLTVADQARITAQPQGGLFRITGASASFSVSAMGFPAPGYQWRFNRTNLVDNGRVSGANGTNLILSALVTADTGSYDVLVTNAYSAVTSLVATLSVLDPPGISVPPQDAAVIVGSNAVFSVTPSGSSPLSFLWQKDGAALSNGGRISGATSDRLTIAAITTNDAGGYSVFISNSVGTATSSTGTLTVLIPATFTSPTNATGRQGAFFSFMNTATGTTPITFGADGLPDGLTVDPTSGVISGIPSVMGVFDVAVYATNAALTTTGQLVLTLTTGVPGITSALSATAKQGQAFSYTITASNDPVSFNASVLPTGLNIDPATGIISGTPAVNGTYPVAIGATNQYGGDSQVLTLTVTSSVPVITSSLTANGKQGRNFSYTIRTTDPALLSARGLPDGVNLDPASGVISGRPIVSGVFQVTLGSTNQFGSDSRVLTLTIASSVPVITSALTATWTENQTNFSYTIRASDTPTLFGASNLPLGLSVNPTSGIISGTPWYGGTFTVPISANNAWGTGSANLVLTINYATVGGLAILNVTTNWSKPYVLDFSFSLRDGADPSTSSPVVLSPSQLQVVCMEDGVPISSESPIILESVLGSSSSKQLKTFLVLDYTYSMYSAPGAIDAMQAAAVLLINEEPPHAMFGIIEFNAEYMAPRFVTNSLTTTNNYFISDKTVLSQSIAGIQTNYVQGNYAGTRCWDAMYAALNAFGTNNTDEQRYLVAMTDGYDTSSQLNTNSDPMVAVTNLYQLAQTKHVTIYCVAFGSNVNTNSLQLLTSQTGGQYFLATTMGDLGMQFQSIQKDISSQYLLRWATLQRTNVPAYPVPGFQPSFQISYGGFSDSWNTNIVTTNITLIDTNQDPAVTNMYSTNVVQFPFNPPDWAGDVLIGSLRLVADADLGPQTIRLRATYVPRYVREIRLSYRPNYPCTASLNSAGPNELLSGWSLTETADTNGLRTLTITSPDPTDLLTSIAYGGFGDLVSFNFTHPESVTATQAFSVFTLDNSIYRDMQPTNQSFVMLNATNFITLYPPPPPHGTPIPWLIAYGYKTDFAAAELIATNGLPVWQAYVAGLNPTNANSRFTVSTAFAPGQVPQIIFNTVPTRTYRVETATSLGTWWVLLDNIQGTGGDILFTDNRVLTGVSAVFYRVAVY